MEIHVKLRVEHWLEVEDDREVQAEDPAVAVVPGPAEDAAAASLAALAAVVLLAAEALSAEAAPVEGAVVCSVPAGPQVAVVPAVREAFSAEHPKHPRPKDRRAKYRVAAHL